MDTAAALAAVLGQTLPAALREAHLEMTRARADATDAHLQRQGMAARLREITGTLAALQQERGALHFANRLLRENLRHDRDLLEQEEAANAQLLALVERLQEENGQLRAMLGQAAAGGAAQPGQ